MKSIYSGIVALMVGIVPISSFAWGGSGTATAFSENVTKWEQNFWVDGESIPRGFGQMANHFFSLDNKEWINVAPLSSSTQQSDETGYESKEPGLIDSSKSVENKTTEDVLRSDSTKEESSAPAPYVFSGNSDAKQQNADTHAKLKTNVFSGGLITLSFDDGWKNQYTNALPLLKKYNFPATFFIITEALSTGGYMTPENIQKISHDGYEIGDHTLTHPDLTTLPKKEARKEIVSSRKYLQNLTGQTVDTLAYPYGAENTSIRTMSKNNGYVAARTASTLWSEGLNASTALRYDIASFSPTTAVSLADMKKAVATAKKENKWLVFSFHKIGGNGKDEYSTTVSDLNELLSYIQNSGIRVVTLRDGAELLH